MIKIVVVDDEDDVRSIIADFIASDTYQVIGQAENGEKALELIKELKPDILISDICMPIMDGLDLIAAVNDLDFPVKTLIMSGYDDFSYARKAIGLGVSDYLLKPFLPDELMETLDKMSAEINKQNMLEKNMVSMQNELEKTKQKQREEFIYSLLEGDCDDVTFLEKSSDFGLELFSDMYCVCDIRQSEANSTNGEKMTVFGALFENFNDAYFDERTKFYVASAKENQILFLFTGEYQNDISFRNEIARGLQKMTDSMKKYHDMRVSCSIGRIYHNWNQIQNSYKEAQAIWKGMLESTKSIIFYSDYEKLNTRFIAEEPKRPKEQEQELLTQIKMNRLDDAVDMLEQIIHYYEGCPLHMQSFVSISLMELLMDMYSQVKKSGGNVGLWEDEEVARNVESNFMNGTLLSMKKILHQYVIKCCEEYGRINESQGDRIVTAVKDMIEKNIGNDEFNLEDISAELYFSIHYIRGIFKQKTGENILEYLIRQRMELAVRILNSPDAKIVDIAKMTGYKNQRYFATAFKKYFGCTPTEYRKNITE